MTPIGFYVDSDNAECSDCHNPGDWPGFEYWPDPAPIWSSDAADSPTHCHQCGDVIAHELTSDGYDHVRERLTRREGRADVLAQWEDAYGHVIGHNPTADHVS